MNRYALFAFVLLGVVLYAQSAEAVECSAGFYISSATISNGCTITPSGTYTMSGETFYLNGTSTGAISINGHNVWLDMNGSTIIGNWTSGNQVPFAIRLTGNNNTVKNGKIYNSSYGVSATGTSRSNLAVVNMTFNNTYQAVRFATKTNSYINDSRFYTSEYLAIGATVASDNLTIYNNYFNTYYSIIDNSNGARILNNQIVGNGSGKGLSVIYNTTDHIIANNNISESGRCVEYAGTYTGVGHGGGRTNITNNRIERCDTGLTIAEAYNVTVAGNTFINNTAPTDSYELDFWAYSIANLTLYNNTFINSTSQAIWLQNITGTANVSANNVTYVSYANRGNFGASDTTDPPSGIRITNTYKSFTEHYNSQSDRYANITLWDSNATFNIYNNIFNNVQAYIIYSGENLTLNTDVTGRTIKYRVPTTYFSPMTYIVNPSFDNLSRYQANEGGWNDTLRAALSSAGNVLDYIKLHNTYYYFNNPTNESQTLILYDMPSGLIYRSWGDWVCSHPTNCSGDVNVTLSPLESVYVLENFTYTNISAISNLTGAAISNFTVNYTNNANSSDSGSIATTDGHAYLPLYNGNYTVTIYDAQQGSTTYAMDTVNLTANPSIASHEFSLYTANSLRIFIRDEANGSIINTTTITVQTSGLSYASTNTTANGTLYLDNLPDGTYNVQFSGGTYTQRGYRVTVGHQSTQELNAYLTTSTTAITFTVKDRYTDLPLEGAITTMARIINSTWTTVESHLSDVSGSQQFIVSTGANYRFTTTKTGYQDKIFYIDQFIFTSYTIPLELDATYVNPSDYAGISIVYTPQAFTNNAGNNITFVISSPEGILNSYNVTVTAPGDNDTASGSNANGETFTLTFNITAANSSDRVQLSYCYTSTLSQGMKCFTALFMISGTAADGTAAQNRDNTYGMGAFERIAIATILVLIVVGLTYPFIGMGGGVLGLLILGYFVLICFIPTWAVIISILSGFAYISWRSSQ